jgi:acyl dehydratase
LNWRWRLIVSVVILVSVRRSYRAVWVIPRPNIRVVGINEVRIVGVVTVGDAVTVSVTCRTVKLAVAVCVGVVTVGDAVTVGVRVVGVRVKPVRQPVTVDVRVGGVVVFSVEETVTITISY